MSTVKGYIDKIKYRNEENGYTVLEVSSEGGDFILVGNFNYIEEGEYIEAEGNMKLHPVYGEQLSVMRYELKEPEDIRGVERYLSSGAVKGVGEALAKRIVKKFKADTLRIMEEEPERLAEVKGISERMAMSIAEQVEARKDMRDAMLFLQKFGISMNLAAKIFREYGPALYSVMAENPYRLADDISGIGFKIADEIAAKSGIQADSAFRIKSGICYVLMQSAMDGNMYLPMEELLLNAQALLGIDAENIREYLSDMQIEKRIVVKPDMESLPVYLSRMYYEEMNTARLLHDLNVKSDEPEESLEKKLENVRESLEVELDELQSLALKEAASSGLLVITGGPGTGKTTTINSIIKYFELQGMEILLAAPTGRAAKRMTEATAHEARTIHRLLEISGMLSENDNREDELLRFERNEENPLEADVIIIDEVSMVDIHLMNALLKAVSVGTRLILAGDINQLPSVGPGNVLKDIIFSGQFNVVRLNKIYRQAAESDIIVNAHKMINSEMIDLSRKSRDFLFIKREEPDAVISAMLTLIRVKLPGYVGAEPEEIQVMTPMRKGPLGVMRLNSILQSYLNPASAEKSEKESGELVFREGDKVMQIKNNYQREWEIRNSFGIPVEKGLGIYNGDMGIIREINNFAELITVEFDEERLAEYSFAEINELEHAYAITIHKSQGSEYPAVIIPVYRGPRMLMTRNLIYTAVTRAKSCAVLLGSAEAFYEMTGNITELKRYSGLSDRIKELAIL